MNMGICRNRACPNAALAQPIERYPGPGEYCPDCGESLTPYVQLGDRAESLRVIESLGSLKIFPAAGEAEPTKPEPPPAPAPAPASADGAKAPRPRKFVLALLAGAIVATLGIASIVRLSASPRSAALHVCASDLTARAATDVLGAYSRHHSGAPLEITNDRGCTVRFVARTTTNDANVFAHDGIVAVVNPQNPIATIDARDLRNILRGALTDWSQLGGTPGVIVPLMVDDSSDEAQATRATLMRDAVIAPRVRRVHSSADIVRLIASASGRNIIGIVPFSAAVPAKVLRVGDAPAPSTLSIGERRYPYTVALAIEDASHEREAADLIRFAQSAEARSVLVADGLVGKGGL
ncbi:MAG: hypothetical protein NVS2B17_22280 [Candidatus Velthaea sp.]